MHDDVTWDEACDVPRGSICLGSICPVPAKRFPGGATLMKNFYIRGNSYRNVGHVKIAANEHHPERRVQAAQERTADVASADARARARTRLRPRRRRVRSGRSAAAAGQSAISCAASVLWVGTRFADYVVASNAFSMRPGPAESGVLRTLLPREGRPAGRTMAGLRGDPRRVVDGPDAARYYRFIRKFPPAYCASCRSPSMRRELCALPDRGGLFFRPALRARPLRSLQRQMLSGACR